MLSNNSIQVVNEVDKKAVFVAASSDLVNVLINLIKNAVEAMQNEDKDSRILKFESHNEDGMCKLYISDTGCGIDSEQLHNLFSFGYTSKSEGHGFGLHSCRSIIRDMEEEI